MLEAVQISKDGPALSQLVMGVMKWGIWGKDLMAQQMLRLIEQCVELGITSFDHADIYGNYTTEEAFGRALSLAPGLRQKLQLVTKCGIKLVCPQRPEHRIKSYDTSIAYIQRAVDRTLKNLGTEHIELLLIHRPSPLMHPDDLAQAFTALRRSGKVAHFGVSNFTPSQFAMLADRFPLVTNQVEASVLHLQPFLDGTLDQALQQRFRPMAWSPLGGGRIFEARHTDARLLRVREAASILADRREGCRIDQILLSWLMQHPSRILPVLGTARIDHIEAAVAALRVEMTREEWFELWSASTGKEVP